jgi:O-antigen/teichoic acid export membrane protein
MSIGFAKKVSASAGMVGANAVLGLLTTIVLAKNLGASSFGLYAFALSMIALLSIPVQAGLPALLVREVAQAKAKENWGYVLGISRFSTLLVMAFSVVMLLGGLLYFYIADRFGLDSSGYAVAWVVFLLIPCLALSAIRSAITKGLGAPGLGQLPELLVKPVMLLGLITVSLYFNSLTTLYAMVFNVLSALCALALGAIILNRMLIKIKAQRVYEVNKWIKALLPFSALAGFNILNSQADIFMLGLIKGEEAVGIYKVSSQFSQIVNLALVAVGVVSTPRIASKFALEDKQGVQSTVSFAAWAIFIISLPIFIVFFVWGGFLIDALFGEGFKSAESILHILLIGQIFNVLAGPVGVVMNMAGRQSLTTIVVMVSAVANIVLNAILIPMYGSLGAAASASISMALWNIALLFFVVKLLHVNPSILGRVNQGKE